jgi:hypothetical protein
VFLPVISRSILDLVDDASRERFYDALDLYNRGEYFESQELLEQLFEEVAAEEKPFVRAVAMLATAMHLHFKHGGGRGVLNLLRQSLLALEDRRDERVGVNVADLYEAMEAYLSELQDRRKPGAGFFDRWLAPRIAFRRR